MESSDRDSKRTRGSTQPMARMGLRALGVWSATTWLIVLCTAVYLVDRLMPSEWVLVSGPHIPANLDTNPGNDVDPRNIAYRGSDENLPPNVVQVRVIAVDRRANLPVGYGVFAKMHALTKHLHFSTALGFLSIEYWRFIGFQFLHFDLTHLIMNMVGLFFFGPLVEDYLGRKRYLAFYILSGIFGALLYLILNLAGVIAAAFGAQEPIPGLIFDDPQTPLVGASAGVFGVIMAGAFIAPRDIVYFFGLVPIRLAWFAYGLVILAAVTVIRGGYNAGGEAGHLGGAIAGFYFIRRPHHLHGFFDILGRVDPTSRHFRGSSTTRTATARPPADEVARILEKIGRTGIESLTEAEQRILADDATRK